MMKRLSLTLLAAALAAVLGATVAGALATSPEDVPTQSPRPVPGSDSIDTQTADPQESLDWAVRIYRSVTGGICLLAGRSDGRTFGIVDAEGRLAAQPLEENGTCGDLSREPFFVISNGIPAREGHPARTVLFGAAVPEVTDVSVVGPDGQRTHAERGPRGTFIVVAPGMVEPPAWTVTITTADGRTVTRKV